MNIFILEDDLIQQQRLERVVKEVTHQHSIEYKRLLTTAKPDYLLGEIDRAANHNLYFLDLEIKGAKETGLEVARQIRKKDLYGTIVFVTTHNEMAPKTFAYKVSALDFIAKDQEEATFTKKIKEALLLVSERSVEPVSVDNFSFQNKYTSFQVPFSDILFFETTDVSHKIRLITKNRMIEFYSDLAEIQKYDERLFRCHRAFLINIKNVISIDKHEKEALFVNDEKCAISRRLLKQTVEKMNE